MQTITKNINLYSGEYNFIFEYDETICGILSDFILYAGNSNDPLILEQGFEDPTADDLAIYPSNIEITLDDDTRTNYNKFLKLKNKYRNTYPLNIENVFQLTIKRNNKIIFKGMLEEMYRDVSDFSIRMNFTDGINKLKDLHIGNPYILQYLYEQGILKRKDDNPTIEGSFFAYGYKFSAPGPGYRSVGFWGIERLDSDKRVNLLNCIEKLFKVFNPNYEVEVNANMWFLSINNLAFNIDFWRAEIEKICSDLLGRFIVLRKSQYPDRLHDLSGDPELEYTKPSYYKVVYEDETFITYWHDWNGTASFEGYTQTVHSGVPVKTFNEILKGLARSLFCSFGIEQSIMKIRFKSKRIRTEAIQINTIYEFRTDTTIKKYDSVKVKDLFGSDSYIQGFSTEDSNNLQFEIPFYWTNQVVQPYPDARLTYSDNSFIHIPISGFREVTLPNRYGFFQQIVARFEIADKGNFTNRVEVVADGIDFDFFQAYKVTHEGVEYIFQPFSISKNLIENKTTLIGREILEPDSVA